MRSTFAALRQRNFRIWMAADFVSVTGRWMQTLAINWFVLQLTGSTTQMGFNLLLQALPVLLLSSWAGALADRFPGRRLLVCTQLAHASLAACLAVVAWHHAGGMSVLYVISILSGLVSTFEGPALGRFTSSTVDADTLGNALALGSLNNSAGRILGMSLGGVAVAVLGPAPLFAGNAAAFLVVIVALFLIRTHKPVDLAEPQKRGVRDGFRYLLTQPVVLITLALAAVLGSLGRNYQVTMAAMSEGPLRAGAAGYGMLSTVFAVGSVAGGFLAARQRRLGYPTLIVAGLVGSALELSAGFSGGLWSFAAAILPIAAAAVLIDTTVSTRVQLDTRADMRGRVLAALAMTSSLSSALGAQLLGWLSDVTGPRSTLALGGVVTLAACVIAAFALSRRLDLSLPTAAQARELLVGVRESAASRRIAVSGRIADSRRLMARRLVAPGRLLSGQLAVVPGQRVDRSTGPRAASRSVAHSTARQAEHTAAAEPVPVTDPAPVLAEEAAAPLVQ
ncbi:MFS transporter [Rugosimonospora africana]|uniref:MFS transporter n=1 Tax=Rugosimonospora africana TaxID=556532 RepID=A0A8J3VPF7_9ACTN|nr:MFS transporter [Rugosimonospora africana]GIH13228.1 MFS transporter [Rugosimonospora africana]